jgi:hypothetical protein
MKELWYEAAGDPDPIIRWTARISLAMALVGIGLAIGLLA